MKYFGRSWSKLSDISERVNTPLGSLCVHCEETIEQGDDGVVLVDGAIFHRDCFLRTMIGSAAHVEKKCSCYIDGSTEIDPKGMSRREAAELAVMLWESRQDENT